MRALRGPRNKSYVRMSTSPVPSPSRNSYRRRSHLRPVLARRLNLHLVQHRLHPLQNLRNAKHPPPLLHELRYGAGAGAGALDGHVGY